MSEHDGLEEMADVLDRNVACLSDDRAHEADKRAVLNIMSWVGITAEQARKLKKECVGDALTWLAQVCDEGQLACPHMDCSDCWIGNARRALGGFDDNRSSDVKPSSGEE